MDKVNFKRPQSQSAVSLSMQVEFHVRSENCYKINPFIKLHNMFKVMKYHTELLILAKQLQVSIKRERERERERDNINFNLSVVDVKAMRQLKSALLRSGNFTSIYRS